MAPAANASDSARVVLPAPLHPIRTTLRSCSGREAGGALPARTVIRSAIDVSSRSDGLTRF